MMQKHFQWLNTIYISIRDQKLEEINLLNYKTEASAFVSLETSNCYFDSLVINVIPKNTELGKAESAII